MPQADTQKGFYKLTKGSHSVGFGADNKIYRANDPKNNIVESEEDLSLSMPEKFVRHEGPPPGRQGSRVKRGEIKPPPAPDEASREIITDLRPMSSEDRRRRAEQLRKRADELEQAADAQDSGEGEEYEEAKSHVREKFAASDNAQEFEEAGEEELDRAEQQQQDEEEEQQQEAQPQRPQGRQQAPTPRPAQRPQPKQTQPTQQAQPAEGEQQGEESSPSEGEEGAEAQQKDDGLDGQNVAQLRATANKERINVRTARTKEDLVSQIRQHRQTQAGRQ